MPASVFPDYCVYHYRIYPPTEYGDYVMYNGGEPATLGLDTCGRQAAPVDDPRGIDGAEALQIVWYSFPQSQHKLYADFVQDGYTKSAEQYVVQLVKAVQARALLHSRLMWYCPSPCVRGIEGWGTNSRLYRACRVS